ncbi:MAG: hypothetical protein ACJA08_002214 [Cyclobacteriaceae bacterium]|jgi:hypothetical protein
MIVKRFGLILFSFVLVSCTTYYQVNQEFNSRFEQGNLESAEKYLKNNKTKRTKFLYYANRGVVNALEGNYEESNKWFERAYIYNEDYRKKVTDVAASLVVNATVIPYKAEDHEQLLLLYYKALNYLKMSNYESALVECRRLNDQLNQLSDRYKSDKKYKRDAFIHNLMGIAYEASGDINNAFIAYRNSYDIYKEDFTNLFGLSAPTQLKQDILRSAYLNGFDNEVYFYENEFGMKYKHETAEAELLFFWHNGLGPIKGEWSINFAVQDGGNGFMTFANSEYGMTYPFPISSLSSEQSTSLKHLKVFRIAFPKYVERPPVFNSAYIETTAGRYDMELAEDINQIAFKTLQERMVKELSVGVLRVALKKAAESAVREESEGWGAVLGLINAFTEKADTRNWQTIPHSIYYSRIPLKVGENQIKLKTQNFKDGGSGTETFIFNVDQKGQTIFHSFQSLETKPFSNAF